MRLTKQIMVIAATLAATTSLVCGQGQQSAESSRNKCIVGTWQVLRHAVDCVTGDQIGPDFPALMTFNRGGTLTAYAVPPTGVTPATQSPEYGVWSHVHNTGTYTVRDVSYQYDTSGVFTGSGVITATLTVDTGADSFSYDATIDFYDANGNLLFSVCGHATGTRFE